MKRTLVVLAAAVGAMVVGATPASATDIQVVGVPEQTTPGSVVTAEVTLTATAAGNIPVELHLIGAEGVGTFGEPTTNTGLTDCRRFGHMGPYTLTPLLRCLWENAQVDETVRLVVPINVSVSAAAGTWVLLTCTGAFGDTTEEDPADPGGCVRRSLAIVAASTSTPEAGGGEASDPVIPSAVPAGEGPLDPPSQGGLPSALLAAAATIVLGGGLAFSIHAARRNKM